MNKYLPRISLLLSIVIPLTVYAAGNLNVRDTLAGLGTDLLFEDFESNEKGTVTVTPPLGPEMEMAFEADSDGNAQVRMRGEDLVEAGIYNVRAKGEKSEAEAQFKVQSDTIDPANSSVQADKDQIQTDGRDTTTVSIIARDTYGNPLEGRIFELISNRVSDTVETLTPETDEGGVQSFRISAREPGTISLRAVDLLSGQTLQSETQLQAGFGMNMGGYVAQQQQPYYQMPYGYPYMYPMPQYTYPQAMQPQVNGRTLYSPPKSTLGAQVGSFDIVTGFELSVPQTLKANEDATMTIRAVDQNGRTVEDYTGMVLLKSTDPDAFLPLSGEVQFQPQNLGEKVLTLGLRFRTLGEQILYAEDATNPGVAGQATIQVSSDGSASERLIKVTSPKGTVNSLSITLEGKASPFINLLVTGATEDVQGETDADGVFSIPVVLQDGKTEHTLRIRDDSGRHDSGNINLKLDNTAPEISSISFTPETAEQGKKVQVKAESNEALGSITLSVGGSTFALARVGSGSFTYAAEVTAPVAGTYQPTLTAKDEAGNTREIKTNLIVKPESLPTVKNLKGEAKGTSAILKWDAVTGAQKYRIYVGNSETNFQDTLETESTVTSATVAGLQAAEKYYFAVTAVADESESLEKSNILALTIQGIKLNVTPGDASLMLSWNTQDSIPLSSYIVEYGVAENQYTEKRVISGDSQTVTLRDLLNGVKYFVRLTPVAVAGTILTDQAALAQGTPGNGSNEFKPTPSDPLPFHPGAPNVDYPRGPNTPSTGIPVPVWFIAAAAAALLFWRIHAKKKARAYQEFLHSMNARYHNQ